MHPKTVFLALLLFAWCGPSVLPVAASAVAEKPGPPLLAAPPGRLAYDFSRPVATYVMPAELAELSGIALNGPDELTGVEDETGRLYHYSLRHKQLVRVEEFGPAGDYEDLARVGSEWFIIRADGTLYRYSGRGTQRYDTGLTLANNVEGLTYAPRTRTLLVACKGRPGGPLTASQRAVYRLHPTTYRVQTPAAYVLDIAAIVAAAPEPDGAAAPAAPIGKKDKKVKYAGALRGFAPSAVAVHPRTGHVFVLSARPNALVELDASGRLLTVEALPPALFPQAEGLAFGPSGDLFIATEAGRKSGQARVYQFRPPPEK